MGERGLATAELEKECRGFLPFLPLSGCGESSPSGAIADQPDNALTVLGKRPFISGHTSKSPKGNLLPVDFPIRCRWHNLSISFMSIRSNSSILTWSFPKAMCLSRYSITGGRYCELVASPTAFVVSLDTSGWRKCKSSPASTLSQARDPLFSIGSFATGIALDTLHIPSRHPSNVILIIADRFSRLAAADLHEPDVSPPPLRC